jgi:hypothetical protein
MTTTSRRSSDPLGRAATQVHRVEEALDSQEIFLLWLEEARQHATLSDLVRSLRGLPEGAQPLFFLTEKAETTARHRLGPDASARIYAGVRDAVREISALYYLFVELNVRVAHERRMMWAHLALLSHALTAWGRDQLSGKASPIASQVRGYLRDLVLWHSVVETISERRYHGHDVLLPGPRQQLDDLKAQAEQLLARFNDHLEFLVWQRQEHGKRTPELPQPISWEALRDELADEVAAEVSLLVDVARAEACGMMGEDQRALAFAERHL